MYLDDSFEQSEHSVSVVIDEDSQAFSLISPKDEHISTPQVNVIWKTPKNMVRKSPIQNQIQKEMLITKK